MFNNRYPKAINFTLILNKIHETTKTLQTMVKEYNKSSFKNKLSPKTRIYESLLTREATFKSQ